MKAPYALDGSTSLNRPGALGPALSHQSERARARVVLPSDTRPRQCSFENGRVEGGSNSFLNSSLIEVVFVLSAL